MKLSVVLTTLPLFLGASTALAQEFDLLLKGGHVIDGKNRLSALRDVAIKNGRIALVAANVASSRALKTVDVSGLYVTPGLIDIHVHVYAGTGERGSYAGDNSVYPDGFTYRTGVTTVADAGSSGWRNFEDFKNRVIDRSRTRILAFLNVVGHGMRGGHFEQDMSDMDARPTGEMALKHKGVIVGIKTAHFGGPEWKPVDQALEAGRAAKIPVMVDFGRAYPERSLAELITSKFRPGDIFTHCYGGARGELIDGRVNPAILPAQKRGVIFDVGHGGGSFVFQTAVQAFKEGFYPNSISTDLHISSMNAGMKDMLNVMSKIMALGMTLDDVILRSTWNPAREVQHEELGHLSAGAIADVAVLRLERGRFGFVDQNGGRLDGDRKLSCEMTLRGGRVVYDLNGLSREPWDKMAPGARGGDPRWDGFAAPAGGGGTRKK
ncbi:MAG: amidohydrolase/deacetylase family metallohydrolase [Acidobacteria bacterium]|nr:amidohydrolase/deacetylase family metallohydrolase [Acidobacteriota bacterium]